MAKARQQFLGVYENMDFPDYKFVEYPKVVGYRDEKKTDPIIVADAKEEVEFITTGSPGAHISREDELQAELERKAVELEQAKKQLAELKAGQDKAKATVAAQPVGKGT
jgi:hypothetical protein